MIIYPIAENKDIIEIDNVNKTIKTNIRLGKLFKIAELVIGPDWEEYQVVYEVYENVLQPYTVPNTPWVIQDTPNLGITYTGGSSGTYTYNENNNTWFTINQDGSVISTDTDPKEMPYVVDMDKVRELEQNNGLGNIHVYYNSGSLNEDVNGNS